MNILVLEPYFGGSHREFALGLQHYSRHTVSLATLPPRFWKWRMRGAALEFFRRHPDPAGYDVIAATSLMNLADLKALWGSACPPLLLYFHENQFSYPLSPGESRDLQYGCTNILSALAADEVVFNSYYHYNDFFTHLSAFAAAMPDSKPAWCREVIERKSLVLYPGCRFSPADPDRPEESERDSPPLIIWNHRWEHDKNPDQFFHALRQVKQRGVPFRLALLGETYDQIPDIFHTARQWFEDELVHAGYIEEREAYCDWLRRGSIVVSTAWQENFGMAVVEAVRFGCHPLLPDRLSYPELVPEHLHRECLYSGDDELVDGLVDLLTSRKPAAVPALQQHAGRFSWEKTIDGYDTLFEQTAETWRKERK